MPGPRNYKPSTVRRLDVLSAGKCSSPTCDKPLLARDGKTIISKICHIEAAEVGGARYNSSMTDDDRRHFDNLILLCDECHSIIDNKENQTIYPVDLLKEWKANHSLKRMIELSRKPSLLISTIDAIASLDFEEVPDDQDFIRSFSPSEKIVQNSIKRNKSLIEEYKVFYSKINSLYDELETQGSFKKDRLLRYIHNLYLKVKDKYTSGRTNESQIIKENSDNIVEDIREILSNKIREQSDSATDEDIEFGIDIVMVDAFVRCKILERPT